MAAVVVLCLVTFLAMAGHSTATYCICKDGLSDSVLQKDIDYACANGADCSHILQNGSCYNPVTVKDHCNYAVNSYYQRKNQVSGSCDFSGSATTTQAVPNQSSGCVYPSSPRHTRRWKMLVPVSGPWCFSESRKAMHFKKNLLMSLQLITKVADEFIKRWTDTEWFVEGDPNDGLSPTTIPSIFELGPTAGSGGTTTVDYKVTVNALHQNTHLLLSGTLFLRV